LYCDNYQAKPTGTQTHLWFPHTPEELYSLHSLTWVAKRRHQQTSNKQPSNIHDMAKNQPPDYMSEKL